MNRFSKKVYYILSAVPFANVILWICIIFSLIRKDMIKGKITSIVLGSVICSMLFFAIPQWILDTCNIPLQIRTVIDFINIVVSVFAIDIYLLSLTGKEKEFSDNTTRKADGN